MLYSSSAYTSAIKNHDSMHYLKLQIRNIVLGLSLIHICSGHGIETLEKALMDSCNDALMQLSYKIGAENFLYYQSLFGFGQKTGVDLPGEANTSTLMYTLDNIKPVDLATPFLPSKML